MGLNFSTEQEIIRFYHLKNSKNQKKEKITSNEEDSLEIENVLVKIKRNFYKNKISLKEAIELAKENPGLAYIDYCNINLNLIEDRYLDLLKETTMHI